MKAPRTQRAVFFGESSITPVWEQRASFTSDSGLVFLDLNSKWFQAYCRALLEPDHEQAQFYIQDALVRIDERLNFPDLGTEERDAIKIATRYLTLMEDEELRRAS